MSASIHVRGSLHLPTLEADHPYKRRCHETDKLSLGLDIASPINDLEMSVLCRGQVCQVSVMSLNLANDINKPTITEAPSVVIGKTAKTGELELAALSIKLSLRN